MRRNELRKLIVGPIATVPTAFDEEYELDYGRMAEATERWIQAGLVEGRSVLKVAAAMGEGPQLREEEWGRVLGTVVEAAKGRGPVMGAVHYKDTVRTIEDARRAADVGVIGLQISPPVFNQPSQEDTLRYYGAVSDAIDIGIMVYNTHWLPHGGIYPDTFRRMVDFENMAAIKWSPPKGVAYEDIFDLAETFTIMDNASQPVLCHKLGGRGFLSDGVDSYPQYYLGVWDLMEAGRYNEAQAEWDRVILPLRAFYAKVVKRSGGEGRVEKAMSEIMGLPMGPPRPPSEPLDGREMAELRGLMMGWGWPVPEPAEAATHSAPTG